MHRSGTSTIARAINLMGVYLGEPSKMMPATEDNAEGYWEHMDIYSLQNRLMARLERSWDTARPLPARWLESEAVRPFRAELADIVATDFGHHSLWGWKEPQTCLLLPLWREELNKTGTQLSCLFVVRNPVDVANSLLRRDGIPFEEGVGIWLHHCLTAMRDAAGIPVVFSSYDRWLAAWEPEMRRCAAALQLDWPKNEQGHREAMNAFIKPNLRHNQSSAEQLRRLPGPVRELHRILDEACELPSVCDDRSTAAVERLFEEFQGYASFFPNGARRPVNEEPLALAMKRLSNSLDDYLAFARPSAGTSKRELVISWRPRESAQFEYLAVASGRPPYRRLQSLLGKKMCRSLCKRLAEICCRLQA
jgi:hypothetical protein